MARIAGVDIPREKRIVISLTYVYGIGTSTANKIVEEANVSADTRVKDLTDDELGRIREVVDGYKVEGDLRREQNLNIKRLMEISSYRGIRHRRGLVISWCSRIQRIKKINSICSSNGFRNCF